MNKFAEAQNPHRAAESHAAYLLSLGSGWSLQKRGDNKRQLVGINHLSYNKLCIFESSLGSVQSQQFHNSIQSDIFLCVLHDEKTHAFSEDGPSTDKKQMYGEIKAKRPDVPLFFHQFFSQKMFWIWIFRKAN